MGGLPNSKCTTLHLLHLCHHHESTQTFHVSCPPNSLSNATREDVPAVSCTNTFRNPCSQKKSAMKSKRPCCEAEVRMRKNGVHTVCQSASKKNNLHLTCDEIDEVLGVLLQPCKSLYIYIIYIYIYLVPTWTVRWHTVLHHECSNKCNSTIQKFSPKTA